MKKLMASLVVAAVLSACALSYGHILVYKGSMKASQTVFDAVSDQADLNSLLSGSTPLYLVVDVCDANGTVLDSNSVIYGKIEGQKVYQLYPDVVLIDPCDPDHHVLVKYFPVNSEFFMVGKGGKATKIFEAPNNNKVAVVSPLKGAGIAEDFNAIGNRLSGSLSISLTLDPKLTKSFNTDGNNVDNGTNAIVNTLNKKNDYIKIPTPILID